MATALDDALRAGREAMERHAWQDALDALKRADAEGTLSADDLELLGQAAWWSGEIDQCIAARERAYAAHLEDGNPAGAARMALLLSRDHGNRNAPALSNGWFRRAERALEGQPESVAHGYLEMMRGRAAQAEGDFDTAIELSQRAVDIGARYGDADLQAMALMYQGMSLTSRGDVKGGWDLVDEATMAAVSGELSPVVTGIVYCNTIGVCSEVADYRRAAEWTEAARRWCERQAINGFPGLCRVHRAEIIRLRGAWTEAEEEARRACQELQGHGIPLFAADGFNEIGTIRLRMGDHAAAEDAFQQANELGMSPQPGLALLRLAQGRVDPAASLINRSLEETAEPLYRVRKLPAQVLISLVAGDLDTAERAADELEKIAERYGSTPFRASASEARARVLLARGEADAVVDHARTAWKLWQEVDAPYEAAVARVVLAEGYRADGDEESAVLELRAAKAAFDKLGAGPDEMRVAALLGEDERPATGPRVVRTFMFTDIERSTNLVEAMGDEAWEELLAWHDGALRNRFAEHGGEEVDHTGDGFFVAFEDARSALECAVAIQRSLAEHRRTSGFAPRVRLGLHLAEAIQQGENYRGRGVHEAARVGALATGAEIVATEETVLAAGDGFPTSEPREATLKGISEPVRVVTVEWR